MVAKRATRYQAKGLAMWAATWNTASLPLPVFLQTRYLFSGVDGLPDAQMFCRFGVRGAF